MKTPTPVTPTRPFVFVCRRCHAEHQPAVFGVVDRGREYGHFATFAEALALGNRITRVRRLAARHREEAQR